MRLTDSDSARLCILAKLAVKLRIVLGGAVFCNVIVEINALESRLGKNVEHIFDTVGIVKSDHICGK